MNKVRQIMNDIGREKERRPNQLNESVYKRDRISQQGRGNERR